MSAPTPASTPRKGVPVAIYVIATIVFLLVGIIIYWLTYSEDNSNMPPVRAIIDGKMPERIKGPDEVFRHQDTLCFGQQKDFTIGRGMTLCINSHGNNYWLSQLEPYDTLGFRIYNIKDYQGVVLKTWSEEKIISDDRNHIEVGIENIRLRPVERTFVVNTKDVVDNRKHP